MAESLKDGLDCSAGLDKRETGLWTKARTGTSAPAPPVRQVARSPHTAFPFLSHPNKFC